MFDITEVENAMNSIKEEVVRDLSDSVKRISSIDKDSEYIVYQSDLKS